MGFIIFIVSTHRTEYNVQPASDKIVPNRKEIVSKCKRYANILPPQSQAQAA